MKASIKVKTTIMILIVGLIIGVAGIIVYDSGINELTQKEYESRSLDIVHAMSKIIDADQLKELRDSVLEIYNEEVRKDAVVFSTEWGSPAFDEYVEQFSEIENTEAFLSLREQLRSVQDVIDVDCLYIGWLDTVNERYIYLVDAAYEDACPPGVTDPLYGPEGMSAQDLVNGCPPNITHTEEYGYLVSTDTPVFTDDGEIVGYAAVDLSMNEIVGHEQELLVKSVSVFIVSIIIACIVGYFLVDRSIIRHINTLSKTAAAYTANDLQFSDINIHTGDEIETLAESLKRMDKDIKDYYDNMIAARQDVQIFKREANIDTLTGLGNKRAYDLAIEETEKGKKPYAIVMIDMNGLKTVNDHYGHECGDIALKNLSELIGSVFEKDHAFRFGGDEFAVIINEAELGSCNEKIEAFRDEIKKSCSEKNAEPWEKINAACGYAVYEQQSDENALSVFKRADDNMYTHKVAMKSDPLYGVL